MFKDTRYKDKTWLESMYKDHSAASIGRMCNVSSSCIGHWLKRFDIPIVIRGYPKSEETRRKIGASTKKSWRRGVYEDCEERRKESIRKAWTDGKFDKKPLPSEETRRKIAETLRANAAKVDKSYKHKDWLIEQYVDNELTMKEVGELCDVSYTTIGTWLEKHNIPIRTSHSDQPDRVRKRRGASASVAQKGRVFSEEHKRKMSEAAQRRFAEGRGPGPASAETKEKLSAIMRERWENGTYDGVFQSPTSIELAVAEALDTLGLEYEFQFRPDGYSRVFDFLVYPDTLIEVQGDYWHGSERPEQQQRDEEKKSYALSNNYNYLALWESDIHQQGAIYLIQEELQHA